MRHPVPQPSEIQAVLRESGNVDFFDELRRRVERGAVVPFVGAGLSVPFGYPAWSEVLRQQAQGAGLMVQVDAYVAGGKFEEAASLLQQELGVGFDMQLKSSFSSRRLEGRTIDGAPRVLTELFRGPVVTSNYDEVIERAYAQQDHRFERLVRPPDEELLSEAFSGNCHYLLQIHGHWAESSSRILTLEQYESFYGGDTAGSFDLSRGLPQALHLMFLSRSVLFLGCSLHQDRYLQVLVKLLAEGWRVPPHFALLERPSSDTQRYARRNELLRLKILPIFFPPGRFDLIPGILEALIPREVSNVALSDAVAQPAETMAEEEESIASEAILLDDDDDLGLPSFGDLDSDEQPEVLPAEPAPLHSPSRDPRRKSAGAARPAPESATQGPRRDGGQTEQAPRDVRRSDDAKPSPPRVTAPVAPPPKPTARPVASRPAAAPVARSPRPSVSAAPSAPEPMAELAKATPKSVPLPPKKPVPKKTAKGEPSSGLVPPPGLLAAIRDGRCLLFAGGGASLDAGLPSWRELVWDLVAMTGRSGAVDSSEEDQLRDWVDRGDVHRAVELCRGRLPEGQVEDFIRLRFEAQGRYSPTHQALARIPFRAALTANFDAFLERSRPGASVVLPEQMEAMGAEGVDAALGGPGDFPIFKIHGSSDSPGSLLLGAEQDPHGPDRAGYRGFLVRLLSTHGVFFYGYSLRDATMDTMLRESLRATAGAGPRHHVFMWTHDEQDAARIRDTYGAHVISDPAGMTPRKALAFLGRLRSGA